MTNIRNVSQLVEYNHKLKLGDSFKIDDTKLYVTDADAINEWRDGLKDKNLGEAELLKKFNEVKDTFASITEPKKEEHHHHHHGHHHHGHHHHHDEHKQEGTPPASPRTTTITTTTAAATAHTDAPKPTIVVTPAEPTPSSPRETTVATATSASAHMDAPKPATSTTTTTTTVGVKPTTPAPTPPKPTTAGEHKPANTDNKKPANHHNFWESFKNGGEKVKEFLFGSHNRTAMTLITGAALGCILMTRTHYFQSIFSKLMQNAKSHFGKQ